MMEMTHALTCPICQGSGIVQIKQPFGKISLSKKEEIGIAEKKTCQGCEGKGWINIP
jgi:DnaJ-class molecular chaperone